MISPRRQHAPTFPSSLFVSVRVMSFSCSLHLQTHSLLLLACLVFWASLPLLGCFARTRFLCLLVLLSRVYSLGIVATVAAFAASTPSTLRSPSTPSAPSSPSARSLCSLHSSHSPHSVRSLLSLRSSAPSTPSAPSGPAFRSPHSTSAALAVRIPLSPFRFPLCSLCSVLWFTLCSEFESRLGLSLIIPVRAGSAGSRLCRDQKGTR